MGNSSRKAIGRNATPDWLTRRTDQFHLALTIHVATANITEPIAMLEKNIQFVT